MFKKTGPNQIDKWVCILETNTKLEVEQVQNYLSNLDIPSNILSKQDSAYSLNIGDMARAYLYVPIEFEEKARKALKEIENSDKKDNNGD